MYNYYSIACEMHVPDIDSGVGGTVVGLVVTVDVPVVLVVIAGHSFIVELTLQVDCVTELLPEYSVYTGI